MTQSSVDVTAVIPLLFLLVTQISSAGREMDLAAVAGNHTSFVFSFLPGWFFPEMGRFNFVHGMNTVVLFIAVVTSAGLTTGLQRTLLVVVSITLWIVTPALEVDEYDQILERFSESGRILYSFHIHIVCIIPYSVGLVVATQRSLVVLNGDRILWSQLWLPGVVLFLSGTAYYVLYMQSLQRELEQFRYPSPDATHD